MSEQERREALADDAAWSSGYAAGRAAERATTAALREALRQAYTLLISAEPTLIRDARTAPNEVSAHYKALLRDRVIAWVDPYRDDFDAGVAALADGSAGETER